MLKKLTIKNFQSHEHTEIVFSPKVTVITGRSQSGKTAILRALNWLINSRPRGFRFHSHFAKKEDKTEVILEINDRIIFHVKDKAEEGWFVNGSIYKGADIPDEILNLLNFTEINMQGQLEEPFLITSSPGEITRVINRVTKLDEVDDWIRNITSQVNTANSQISLVQDEIQEIGEKIERYEGLDEIEEPLDRLDIVQNKVNDLDIGIKLLSQLIEDLGWNEEEIESLKWVDEAEKLLLQVTETETFISWVDNVLETDDRIYQLVEEMQVLDGIDDQFRELNDIVLWFGKYERLENIVQNIRVIGKEIKVIERINVSFKELDDITEWLIGYEEDEELIWNFEETEKEVNEFEKKVETERSKYTEKLKEMKICPICFGDMNDAAVKRIEEELR